MPLPSIDVYAPSEWITAVETYANENGLSRSEAVRDLTEHGLDAVGADTIKARLDAVSEDAE